MLDIEILKRALADKDLNKVAQIIKDFDLKIEGNKITADTSTRKKYIEYWDMMQLITKVKLNSLYGSIGNIGSRFFDPRIAQSTTLSGRCIVKHMGSKINEIITGDYNHVGQSIIYGDTDSTVSDSVIETSIGKKTIEDLFLNGTFFWNKGQKEYSCNDKIHVLEYNHNKNVVTFKPYNYVYRHKVSKKKFKITTVDEKSVIVTEDHSIMILDENNILVEKKPRDIKPNDKIISL